MIVYRCDLCNNIHDEKTEMNTLRIRYMGVAEVTFYKDGDFHLCEHCTGKILNMFKEAGEKTSTPKEIKVITTGTPIKSKLDDGKIKALREAGWSLEKIADEMGCAPQTVANHLNAMGGK